jgi:cytochrome oxidase Cu insertion factor (SCO1/SenC/PrrC family)
MQSGQAMIRTPLALIPYLFLAAFVAAGALWNLSSGTTLQGALAGSAIGGPFTLTDQNGKTVSDADFHGHDVLLYFGYTNCPDVCPTTLAVIADAMSKPGSKAKSLTPIFITIDPARDTPKVLKTYLASFGPRFVGLTGSADDIKKVATEYRVYYAKHPLQGGGYAMDHSSELYLLDPRGRLMTFYDAGIDAKSLAADLAKRL